LLLLGDDLSPGIATCVIPELDLLR